jgi:hypothetical protein
VRRKIQKQYPRLTVSGGQRTHFVGNFIQGRVTGAVLGTVNNPLTMVADLQGAVVLGFVSKDIFYMRFTGHVTTRLGSKCAALLRRQLSSHAVQGIFCDGDQPSIDLSARSEIVRAFLDNRRHLESMATLVGTPEVAPTLRAIATVLDCLAHIADTADDFHGMLIRAAPYAQAKLPRDTWARAPLSERPGRNSARMRIAPRRS